MAVSGEIDVICLVAVLKETLGVAYSKMKEEFGLEAATLKVCLCRGPAMLICIVEKEGISIIARPVLLFKVAIFWNIFMFSLFKILVQFDSRNMSFIQK